METEKKSVAFEARQMLRGATRASLATIDAATGAPYVSLAAVATLIDGRPVTLLSTLARHTQNLASNPSASLLIEVPAKTGGVMAGSRVTLSGSMTPVDEPQARRRYLARHEDASDFVDFTDFGFYSMDVAEAHFIATFGRIHTLEGEVLLPSHPADAALADIEAGAVSHMNDDHTDAIQDYATGLAGAPAGNWRMADLDREGFTLVSNYRLLRMVFPKPIESAADLRKSLTKLAKQARISR